MSILYANQSPEDILCQEELDAVAKDPRVKVRADRITITHILPQLLVTTNYFDA